jgi:DNA polymerase
LQEKIAALTAGEITSAAQNLRVLKWLAQHGCELPNVQEETLVEALERPDIPADARQLIELRLVGAHAAVNKLATMRRWASADHRIRYAYRYHGAMPGRLSSMGVQLQNLKKPTIKDIGAAIAAVRASSLTHLKKCYDQPLGVVGDITRGLIVSAPRHRLFIADLSGVESRGLAWLTDEHSKLAAWKEFDRTGDATLEPYYQLDQEFGIKGDGARNTGKTGDLAFQYQGSLRAWRRLAPAGDQTPDQKVYEYRRAWMRRHPSIRKFWTTSVRQALNALEHSGESFTVARIAFVHEGQFLHLELPSGRRIRYPFARTYASDHGKTFTFRDASGGRWEWYHVLKKGRGAFGGLIAENATQALCRDIFVDAMLRLESAGYCIVAHLHGEFVCEVPDDFGDLDTFRAIITTPPTWAPDFPVAAKARIADRFIEIKEARTEIVSDEATITQSDLDEINIGLRREGVEPISLSAAATASVELPRNFEMPPMPPGNR